MNDNPLSTTDSSTKKSTKTEKVVEEAKVVKPGVLKPSDGNTLVFKRSHLYAVLLPLAFVLGLSVGFLFWGRQAKLSAAPRAAASTPTTTDQQSVKRYEVPTDNDPAIGPANAPITLIEFSDYE
jgi:uncharacterized protein HemX